MSKKMLGAPTIGTNGGTLGRPRKEPPADAKERIWLLASKGHSMRGLASGFKVSYDTLSRWLDESPDLKEAFESGRDEERRVLHNILFQQAEKGNTIAAIFLLKARHSYKEGESMQGNGVNVTIQMPGAMSMKDFMSFDNEPSNRPESVPATAAITTRRG